MAVKKALVLLVLLLIPGLAGCGVSQGDLADRADEAWKIGIITSPVAPNEEAYRMAEQMQQMYGADRILHATYPDRFIQEQEAIITYMLEMAYDPDVKAIIMIHAVPGALSAVSKVRELREDILIILGFPQEDPDALAKQVDILLDTEDVARGDRIAEEAHARGAEVIVHYSFPRHMLTRVLVERREMIRERAEELNILFLYEDVPDPVVGLGPQETQLFILEDVPRKIEQYGSNTAFLVTNDVMLDPLISRLLDYDGITLVQCCPSPYHSVPAALGIEVPDEKKGDVQWIMEQQEARVAREETAGRVAAWPVSVNMLFVETAVEYAVEWINGNTDGRVDKEKIIKIITGITAGPVKLTDYSGIENYLFYGSEEVVFSTRP